MVDEYTRAKYSKLFDSFETNKDGRLDEKELNDLAVALKMDKYDILKMLDENGDGVIEKEEFITKFSQIVKLKNRMKRLFSKYDADYSGTLEKGQEFLKLLNELGIDKEKQNELIKVIDDDGDGTISEDELLRHCVRILEFSKNGLK